MSPLAALTCAVMAIGCGYMANTYADEVDPSEFPIIEGFPDPFLMTNGTRAGSTTDWPDRREEMIELLLRHEYGRVPPAPGNVEVESEELVDANDSGGPSFKIIRLRMGPQHAIPMTMHLYLPMDRSGPFPTILRVGLAQPIVEEMHARGYAFACFQHRDLDPETEGHDVAGPAQTAYPKYDWGSIAVWAWGASRALDYLSTCPEIDVRKVVVTGHSRTGKAALLAGALDERFAVVVPNGSGCGGAGAFRVVGEGAETLELITRKSRFFSWFHKDFAGFGDKENRLPFDQHFLRALVAPRGLLSTDALGDTWANPLGTQAAYRAAMPVFEFLDAPGRNAIHFRPGQHDQLPEDYRALLDFADLCFHAKPLPGGFNVLPFPEHELQLGWSAP